MCGCLGGWGLSVRSSAISQPPQHQPAAASAIFCASPWQPVYSLPPVGAKRDMASRTRDATVCLRTTRRADPRLPRTSPFFFIRQHLNTMIHVLAAFATRVRARARARERERERKIRERGGRGGGREVHSSTLAPLLTPSCLCILLPATHPQLEVKGASTALHS
jgi:hypothetical protein